MLDKFKSMLDEIKIVTYEYIFKFDFNQYFPLAVHYNP